MEDDTSEETLISSDSEKSILLKRPKLRTSSSPEISVVRCFYNATHTIRVDEVKTHYKICSTKLESKRYYPYYPYGNFDNIQLRFCESTSRPLRPSRNFDNQREDIDFLHAEMFREDFEDSLSRRSREIDFDSISASSSASHNKRAKIKNIFKTCSKKMKSKAKPQRCVKKKNKKCRSRDSDCVNSRKAAGFPNISKFFSLKKNNWWEKIFRFGSRKGKRTDKSDDKPLEKSSSKYKNDDKQLEKSSSEYKNDDKQIGASCSKPCKDDNQLGATCLDYYKDDNSTGESSLKYRRNDKRLDTACSQHYKNDKEIRPSSPKYKIQNQQLGASCSQLWNDYEQAEASCSQRWDEEQLRVSFTQLWSDDEQLGASDSQRCNDDQFEASCSQLWKQNEASCSNCGKEKKDFVASCSKYLNEDEVAKYLCSKYPTEEGLVNSLCSHCCTAYKLGILYQSFWDHASYEVEDEDEDEDDIPTESESLEVWPDEANRNMEDLEEMDDIPSNQTFSESSGIMTDESAAWMQAFNDEDENAFNNEN